MALRPPDPRLADDVVSLRPLASGDVSAVEAALDDPEITRWFDNSGVSAQDVVDRAASRWEQSEAAEFAMVVRRARRQADQFAHRSEERFVATGRRTSRIPSGGRAPFVGRRQRRTRRPRFVLAASVGSLARTLAVPIVLLVRASWSIFRCFPPSTRPPTTLPGGLTGLYLPREVFFGRLGFASAFVPVCPSDFGRFFPATSG